jgi:hypothetical protein
VVHVTSNGARACSIKEQVVVKLNNITTVAIEVSSKSNFAKVLTKQFITIDTLSRDHTILLGLGFVVHYKQGKPLVKLPLQCHIRARNVDAVGVYVALHQVKPPSTIPVVTLAMQRLAPDATLYFNLWWLNCPPFVLSKHMDGILWPVDNVMCWLNKASRVA